MHRDPGGMEGAGQGNGPEGCRRPSIAGLILAALRFARPDGGPSMTLDGVATNPTRDLEFRGLAEWYRGTGIGRRAGLVVRSEEKEQAPLLFPPGHPRIASWRSFVPIGCQPAISWPWITETSAPLSLRALRWRPVLARGRTGDVRGLSELTSRPRPRTWISGSVADLAEWSHRAGRCRITRSSLLLRGRRLALLSAWSRDRSRPAYRGSDDATVAPAARSWPRPGG